MEKDEHARRLKRAMADKGIKREELADAVGKKPRTITNWTTAFSMPDESDRAKLRRIFPGYDAQGDPVEVAIRNSELLDYRQNLVIGEYQRHLHEQRRESSA
jgi:transcriptional regulator with XRE-family HTH domain